MRFLHDPQLEAQLDSRPSTDTVDAIETFSDPAALSAWWMAYKRDMLLMALELDCL